MCPSRYADRTTNALRRNSRPAIERLDCGTIGSRQFGDELYFKLGHSRIISDMFFLQIVETDLASLRCGKHELVCPARRAGCYGEPDLFGGAAVIEENEMDSIS